MPSGHRPPLRSILRTSRLSRRSVTRGSTSGDNHVDLLQLVDAQATACAALIEESHASMRELLQKSRHRGAVNTARFSERLGAQLEHLRVFLLEECSNLQHTIARREPGCRDCRSWQETCFGRRGLCLAKGLGPEFGDGKQIWWSRQFRSTYLEYAYRQHHYEVWRRRVRIIAVLTSIGVAYLTASSFMAREPSQDALIYPPLPPPPPPPRPPRPLEQGSRFFTPIAHCPRAFPHRPQAGMDTRVADSHLDLLRRLVLLKPHAHRAHVRCPSPPRPLAPLQPGYRRPARLGHMVRSARLGQPG